MSGGSLDSSPRGQPSRAEHPGWIRLVALVALVAAFGFVVVRFAKKDVVSNWAVLASCPTIEDIGGDRVSSSLDTSACLTPPQDVRSPRGWPIFTFVLPSTVGTSPQITGVTSNTETHSVSIGYDDPPRSESTETGGHVLVFVEVQPDSLPTPPYTVHDVARTTVS